MPQIKVIDRITKKEEIERIYGGWALSLLYEKKWGKIFLPLIAKVPFFSRLYGFLQSLPFSRKKILPFIRKYHVDVSEFAKKTEAFSSFNDFFTRKLKPASRPINKEKDRAIIFADGRYIFFQDVEESKTFWIKGESFSLEKLLQDKALAKRYKKGSMAIARLCPTDYHRFHFPFDATPNEPRYINGPLYSVNPLALKNNIRFLCENKRVITLLQSDLFSEVIYIEIGATYVGSIKQTFSPFEPYKKGEEKGFFSFGGSCIILLFQKGKILFDEDLLLITREKKEVKCLLGQSLGKASS